MMLTLNTDLHQIAVFEKFIRGIDGIENASDSSNHIILQLREWGYVHCSINAQGNRSYSVWFARAEGKDEVRCQGDTPLAALVTAAKAALHNIYLEGAYAKTVTYTLPSVFVRHLDAEILEHVECYAAEYNRRFEKAYVHPKTYQDLCKMRDQTGITEYPMFYPDSQGRLLVADLPAERNEDTPQGVIVFALADNR